MTGKSCGRSPLVWTRIKKGKGICFSGPVCLHVWPVLTERWLVLFYFQKPIWGDLQSQPSLTRGGLFNIREALLSVVNSDTEGLLLCIRRRFWPIRKGPVRIAQGLDDGLTDLSDRQITAYFSASKTNRPSKIVVSTLVSLISSCCPLSASSTMLRSSTIMSASLPASSVPSSSCRAINLALFRV